jgi:uncharacterized membrane protein
VAAEPNDTAPGVTAHTEKTNRSIAGLHAEYFRKATSFQRTVVRVTAILAGPRFFGLMTFGFVGWIIKDTHVESEKTPRPESRHRRRPGGGGSWEGTKPDAGG